MTDNADYLLASKAFGGSGSAKGPMPIFGDKKTRRRAVTLVIGAVWLLVSAFSVALVIYWRVGPGYVKPQTEYQKEQVVHADALSNYMRRGKSK